MFKLLMAGGVALALSASFASAATYVFDYTKNDRNIDVHGYGAIDFSDMTVSNKIGQDRYESNATRLGFRGDDNNVQNYYTTTGFSGFSGASEMSLRDPSHFNGQAMGFIAFGNRAYISLDDDYRVGRRDVFHRRHQEPGVLSPRSEFRRHHHLRNEQDRILKERGILG